MRLPLPRRRSWGMLVPLDVPFEERSAATWAGARFDRRLRIWVADIEGVSSSSPAEELERLAGPKLARFLPPEYSIPRLRWADLNDGTPSLRRFSLGSLPSFLAPHPDPAAAPDGTPVISLRPHQQEASDAIVAAHRVGLPGFLLADEVGLGKTFAVIDAVHRLAQGRKSGLRVLVLAPLSVVPAWRRSLSLVGDGGHLWVVSNYERARQLLSVPASAKSAKRTRTKNRRHAAEGRSILSWDVVICDESHRLKNPASQRSTATRRLISTGPSGERSQPAFTIWMSATAGQNPLELAYLAPLLAARTGQSARSLADFEEWCRHLGFGVRRGRFGNWEWAGSAADPKDPKAAARRRADLWRMRRLLFDPFDASLLSVSDSARRRRGAAFRDELASLPADVPDGSPAPKPASGQVVAALRRRPQDVAGWPELVRVLMPQELSSSERALYEEAWEEFRSEMARLDLVEDHPASRSRTASALVAALRFRQKASLLRAPHTAALIRDMLADGFQVAVSVQFLESAEVISRHLDGVSHVVLSGEVEAAERERRRLAFQSGESPVVLFTPTEGFSLHASEILSSEAGVEQRASSAPRTLLIHDLRWSALELAQIEGRTHRDGQSAVAHYLFAEGTVEETVVSRVLSRLSDMAEMLGDDTVVLDELLALVD